MLGTRHALPLVLTLAHALPLSAQVEMRPAEPVRFNRDVRPILSNSCYRCHGPDAGSRKAGLRLDVRDDAIARRDSGAAIVPGDAARSLLIQRVAHADLDERMPPHDKADALTNVEIETLRRWIDEGARWQAHWSLEPLVSPAIPDVENASFVRNPVDRFLARRLDAVGMEPSAQADPRTLIRRLHVDLIGMPPPPERVRAFVADPSDALYESIVDDLLASTQHAERLTVYWLDLVRYGDSSGIHGDQPISMSPYRDWVIDAFHENMPFDRFTRDQLAGDLLPNATLQQRVASGYNRLNMKTAEGGAQEAEYLAKYAADRVRTTATVWLGATLGCAECHDHKFDPFTARDFYRMAAFFADLDHKGYYADAHRTGNWGPKVGVPTDAQAEELAERRAVADRLDQELNTDSPERARTRKAWETQTLQHLAEQRPPVLGQWRKIGPFRAKGHRAAFDTAFGPEAPDGTDPSRPIRSLRWEEKPEWRDGAIHRLHGDNSATYLYREVESSVEQNAQLSLGSDDAIKLWVNGESVLDKFVARGVQPGQEKPEIHLRRGRNTLLMKITNGGGGYGFYFELGDSGPPEPIVAILKTNESERTDEQRRTIREHYRQHAPELTELRRRLAAAERSLTDLEKTVTTTLVSRTRDEPRLTRVLHRGDWQDESGDVVQPGVPACLPGAGDFDTSRRTRLDLANWIVRNDNPLPARVMVNRLWKLCFGRGLSPILDDLGAQGERPEQLALMEWLASEFRRDWNVRRLLRLIVTSGAYRQSSEVSARARERDPENRLFARQNRFRFDAEFVRDQALAVSGLLDPTVGGPSVKPYQPAGYWAELNFPKRRWVADPGDAQYRRGLYTHWQRTFLHPSLRAFDAPSREECTAERPRSNTPLQALALLNDPTYVEAARVLAARTLAEDGEFETRLVCMFDRVLQRVPRADEVATLRHLFDAQHARYAEDPTAATAVSTVGQAARPTVDPTEHAAWTAVARALLNLHEAITRY